jgi:hypothetical protein
MSSLLRALAVFALLCGSTIMAFLLKSQLLQSYAKTGALESMNLIISFLVTITAIVIGLLINATKSFIDTTQDHWAIFAGQLIRLDQSLRNYGPESEQLRGQPEVHRSGDRQFVARRCHPNQCELPECPQIAERRRKTCAE